MPKYYEGILNESPYPLYYGWTPRWYFAVYTDPKTGARYDVNVEKLVAAARGDTSQALKLRREIRAQGVSMDQILEGVRAYGCFKVHYDLAVPAWLRNQLRNRAPTPA